LIGESDPQLLRNDADSIGARLNVQNAAISHGQETLQKFSIGIPTSNG